MKIWPIFLILMLTLSLPALADEDKNPKEGTQCNDDRSAKSTAAPEVPAEETSGTEAEQE